MALFSFGIEISGVCFAGKLKQNCAKWCEIFVTIFPDRVSPLASVDIIITIIVFDRGVILLGDLTWEIREVDQDLPRKSVVLALASCFNKSILKSPIKTMSLFFSRSSFSHR